MSVPKILLYYVFTPLADPDAVRIWQHDLCESLGLRGRILLSKHGMNGTVGGDLDAVKWYLRATRSFSPFADLEVKWSEGSGFVQVPVTTLSEPVRRSGWVQRTADGLALLSSDFPRLSVKVRSEIVSFGAPNELEVCESGVVGGGKRLSPTALHQLVAERGDDVVFFDGRNAFEAQIGRFRDAVIPDVATTRDFVQELDSGRYDNLKDRPIVTYCTGGVRCEVLSTLMRRRGFGEVYQLDGGIAQYGEAFGDDGLWNGSLYVFDNRVSTTFSDHPAVIGHCFSCDAPTSRMQNCSETSCRSQLVVCESCRSQLAVCDTCAGTDPARLMRPIR